MGLIISDRFLKDNKVTLEQVLVGLLCKNDINKTIDELIGEGKIIKRGDSIHITQGFNDVVDSICLSSNPDLPSYEECLSQAKTLRTVVPQYPKKGTPYYYVCNNAEVTLSLQKLYYYYGNDLELLYGNDVFDSILEVTKDFYSRINEDNAAYYPLLKYFIIKTDGDISSPLMSEIEMIRDGTDRETTGDS